jgi:hypothetical protein
MILISMNALNTRSYFSLIRLTSDDDTSSIQPQRLASSKGFTRTTSVTSPDTQTSIRDVKRSQSTHVHSSDRPKAPYTDAKSIGLYLRLKQLKKQLSRALRSPIAGLSVAASSAALPHTTISLASDAPAGAKVSSLAATGTGTVRRLGRAPADDASAGPWEFPGEPGLYSSLKRSLGQVTNITAQPHPICMHPRNPRSARRCRTWCRTTSTIRSSRRSSTAAARRWVRYPVCRFVRLCSTARPLDVGSIDRDPSPHSLRLPGAAQVSCAALLPRGFWWLYGKVGGYKTLCNLLPYCPTGAAILPYCPTGQGGALAGWEGGGDGVEGWKGR